MGGMCSSGISKDEPAEVLPVKSSNLSRKIKSIRSFGERKRADAHCYPDADDHHVFDNKSEQNFDSGEIHFSISRELKPSTPVRNGPVKVTQSNSLIGRAGIAGLEKAVEVLDTLGSSVSNLNNSGFISGMGSRGNRISILAFEIANTIAKGANLLKSLSEENIQILKKEILRSEQVQQLVSKDINELLTIAAADKREEFGVFSREVIRFGDLCKDPQWHNLDRFFSRLDSEQVYHKQQLEEAERIMLQLTTLAHQTSELYHELNAFDRCEQDFKRKLEEVASLNLPRRGEDVLILQSELKHQKKVVRSLKKKSLWGKTYEEVVEKLVDIVTFIHQQITEAFEDNGGSAQVGKVQSKQPERLGPAGLALHYANIINQIDNIASRPMSLPPNVRDTLYQGLPNSVKSSLRSEVLGVGSDGDLTVAQIKGEMEKTLKWLGPIATNTTKSHQGFGWVGEWANTSNELKTVIRLQTFYHADKQKMDRHVLELSKWLHQLILTRQRENGVRTQTIRSSPTKKGTNLQVSPSSGHHQLSEEDRSLLEEVMRRKSVVTGKSKSQELGLVVKQQRRANKVWALSRSTGSSPTRSLLLTHRESDLLDVLDGLDT
ncbi:protein PSK SIMULATOR 2-like isoform X2 [Impatiens glandulifera]|uniref:protein PSK SIMULATOR 2-like isoform X2 n=1 Tax=Impatiens glandulifera TaxID=253017 RepID=UPI001FB16CC9|nr:protein PSK SIMULATOR 2-like isoform X2 [Impatiens glandulifera]